MTFFSKLFKKRSGALPPAPLTTWHDGKLLIAVMGATGSGKSSFISLATGKTVVVSNRLESCTTEIQEVDVQIDEKTVTLIDTPGFDDTNKTDTEILTAIANYLESNYRQNHRLTGVIFLHRITDNRMGGVSNKNVLMFQKLVGDSVLDHVICCSTMWDHMEQSEGEFAGRETELRERYWVNMIANGAQMARHDNTAQSAHSVINKLLNLKPVALKIQRELVDNQKKLSETSAGREVNKELEMAATRQKQELQETKARLERERAKNEARLARELKRQRRDRDRILQKQERARARLEEEMLEERRRLEDLAVEAERRAQAAREHRERVRFTRQASFGIIVDGYWAQIVAKGNWSNSPSSYSVCRKYREPYPPLYIVQDIFMHTGDPSNPIFALAPNGALYAGFSIIGTISADMSGCPLWESGWHCWDLNYKVYLSIDTEYQEVSAWMEWWDEVTWTRTSSTSVFNIDLCKGSRTEYPEELTTCPHQ